MKTKETKELLVTYQWTYETFDRLPDFDAGKSITQAMH
jgi:hypothetical protein